MASIKKLSDIKKPTIKTKKGLQRFALPGRDPDKATEELFGIWKDRDISIVKVRRKGIAINPNN